MATPGILFAFRHAGFNMARHERRKAMPLDEAYVYFRRLEAKIERPALFRTCNAIATIDLALLPEGELAPGAIGHLSPEAWSRIRDQLFKILLTSFPGYFLVYARDEGQPLESGSTWPNDGRVEFYPEKILRRFEHYSANLDRLDPGIVTTLRWCFGQDKQKVDPATFADFNCETELATEFLDRLYEICEDEAVQGKKIAHRKWWQLYWEANGCPDRRQRYELQKQMLSLQSVWGRPAQPV